MHCGKTGSRRTEILRDDEGSSLPSNRLDIAPLCQEGAVLTGPCLDAGSGPDAVPAIYMAALPFPGRTDGRRLTITDEERGMI